MSGKTIIVIVSMLLMALLFAACSGPQGSEGPEYVTSTACADCHEDIAAAYNRSGHAFMLNKVVDGQPPKYPFTEAPEPPDGYTWDDISYVVGGYNWKARFVDLEGYIITGPPGTRGDATAATGYSNQYNFASPVVGIEAGWGNWHLGEKKAYDCGTCHTTGYNPNGHQDNLPGLVGTWAETGIACEKCHGPGSQHVANPDIVSLEIEQDSESCADCHVRGSIKNLSRECGIHQNKLNCVICHDPHAGVIGVSQK